MESLFSLEVIINYVKLTTKTTCLIPSMAFRLLDYPTIAINLLDEYDSSEIKSKLNTKELIDDINRLPCFAELLDKHGRYIFSRGKSCLFRSDLDVLKNHLKTTPMYLMLLDTFFEPYKLVGTVLVPMFNLINDIGNEIEQTECKDAPVTKMTHGLLDIKNLLGEELGHVSFACRLTSYGTSLLPHIETTATEAFQRKFKQIVEKKTNEISIKKNDLNMSQKSKVEENSNEIKNEIHLYELTKPPSKPEKQANALVQTVKIDYKDAQIQINDEVPVKELAKPKVCKLDEQFREPLRKSNIYSVKREPDDFGHYSPPALIYNSTTDKSNKLNFDPSSSKIAQLATQKNVLDDRIGYLNNIAAHLKQTFNNEIENDSNDKEEDNEESREVLIQPPKEQTRQNNKNLINLDNMPLLKCLFDEMNLIKNMLETNQQPQAPILQQKAFQETKNVVGILRNTSLIKTRTNNKPINKSKPTASKQDILESVNRLSTPRQQEKASNKSVSTNPYDEIPVGPKTQVAKAKKPPLKYGTTNTHRMRVLANNPNKLNEINLKHTKLMHEIKTNLDDLNFSNTQNTPSFNESIGNHLEKVLFESTMGSNSSGTGTTVLTSTLQKSNKPMNFSLLNRVELESTNDNTLFLANKSKQLEENLVAQAGKVVQFGNTYVLNTSSGPNSEESNKKLSEQSSEQSSSNHFSESFENDDDSAAFNRNIFRENKSYDDDDFHSSLDSSLTSTRQTSTASSFYSFEKRDKKKRELLRQSSISSIQE